MKPHPTNVGFEALGLSREVLQAVRELGYESPTPIQIQAIPPAIQGRDVVACSQTGTGKTAAFGIPMIERLKHGRHLRGLVLAPTRELALQITDNLRELAVHTALKVACIHGGVPVQPHIQAVRAHPDILVATPGRLLDVMRHRALRLEGIEIFVLDEADRMLDMGFAEEIDAILNCLLPERQTMLFSATMPAAVRELVRTGVRDPVSIEIAPRLTPVETIHQEVRVIDNEHGKTRALLDLLREEKGTVLVFAGTKRRAEQLARQIHRAGLSVARIHGDMEQAQRNHALAGFRSGRFRILVATDVASRGLDIEEIAHVVNYDLPRAVEDYVHRIGRTGRAGASGRATTLLTAEDRRLLHKPLARALGVAADDEHTPVTRRRRSRKRRRASGVKAPAAS